MTQHIELDYSDPVHEGFFDAIQELLGSSSHNFRIAVKNGTTLQIVAGVDNDQVAIAINGKYRWRTTETTAALPGGLANGEHPVFVTASANNFGGPLGDPDVGTDYTFGLQIKPTGETPATAQYRRVGTVSVVGGAITGFEQLVDAVSGAQIKSGALSANGPLTWTREQSGAWVPALKTDSVTATQIATDAVGTAEIAVNAVGASEIAENAVGSSEIAADAVGASEIIAGGVGESELASGAVSSAKLGSSAKALFPQLSGVSGSVMARGQFSIFVDSAGNSANTPIFHGMGVTPYVQLTPVVAASYGGRFDTHVTESNSSYFAAQLFSGALPEGVVIQVNWLALN